MGVSPKTQRTVTDVADSIRLRIKSDEYRAGAALPAELDLAEEFSVSRPTIRRVIESLIASGDLSRRPHSRPIVSMRWDRPALGKSQEIPVWVSLPVAEGPVLSFLKGVSNSLSGTPYQMVVREPRRFTGQIVHSDERRFLQDLLTGQDFAGAILYRDHFPQNQDLIHLLGQTGKPLVFVESPPPSDVKADYVVTANALAARTCVEHLVELGHTRIAFLADTDFPETTQNRIKGYRLAMRIAGLEDRTCVLVAEDEEPARVQPRTAGPFARLTNPSGYFCELANRVVRRVLEMDPLPTAIFACHDVFAVTVGALLAGAGLQLPGDMSLVGFDWLADFDKKFPDELTTAAQPFQGFGIHAASLLLDRVSGETTAPCRHALLDAPLVIRSSTAPNFSLPVLGPAQRLDGPVAV